ncbi:MAG: hypothetical protein LBB61_09705, partial [Treponema sp.]|nr:hypothetical protein [Treponema sp.]
METRRIRPSCANPAAIDLIIVTIDLIVRVHTTQSNTNTSEIDKSGKDTGKFVIAGANPSKSLQPP